MNQLLGDRIRDLRIANKLTQERVADQLGISRQKYARIENGTNSITLELLTQISSFLDVTISDITKVLDQEPAVAYRSGEGVTSSKRIMDMLDLFYANKHLYDKIKQDAQE